MNVKSLAIGIVSFAIMGLMLVSVLVPVLSDGIDSNKDPFSNSSVRRFYAEDRTDEEVNAVLDSTGFYLDGVKVTRSKAAPYILSEGGTYIYSSSSSNSYFAYDGGYYSVTAFNLVYNSGSITGTITTGGNEVEIDAAYEHAYFYSASASKLVVLQAGESADLYFPVNAPLFAEAGSTGTGNFMLVGTLDNPQLYYNGTLVENATFNIDVESIEGYTDVCVVHGYMSATYGDEENPSTITFSRIIGQNVVLGEKEENKTIDTIIQIIPLLIGAGLVVMAVRYFLLSRE